VILQFTRTTRSLIGLAAGLVLGAEIGSAVAGEPGRPSRAAVLKPVVEFEEDVYTYTPADNGAGPLWCSGSTCLVRLDKEIFASGLETLSDVKPLNNCRWVLYRREPSGWRLQQADLSGRTREPCPIVGFSKGPLILSGNPTLTEPGTYAGPARPELLEFSTANPKLPFERLLPVWDGSPQFSEHSYRSLAADGRGRELILFQNIGYTHAEWTFRNRSGKWAAQGRLRWPEGRDFPKPEPIRVCYPDVALQKRAVHFCGVSDIIEPYPEWRAFKKQLTGQEWDYDFRRLFYTWTPDITHEPFREWIEIASRDKTCGWISPGDLWVAPDGAAHVVWTERALDERLRTQFFPEARQSHALNYAIVRDGKVVLRRTLVLAKEDERGEVPSAPRFQVTPENRLILVFCVQGTNPAGKSLCENRVMEILPGGETGMRVKLPLQRPFVSYFTATVRGGSPASRTLEMLGQREGLPSKMSYARVTLW
jgi:hypothetical protein